MAKPKAIYLAPVDPSATKHKVPKAWRKRTKRIDHSSKVWSDLRCGYPRWPQELVKRYQVFIVDHKKGRVGHATGKVVQLALQRRRLVVCKGPKGRVRQVKRIAKIEGEEWDCNWTLKLVKL